MNKIFVNGSFDIIHEGHLILLGKARSLGENLLVAVDSDARIRRLKGSNRPINSAYDRCYLLRSLRYVDDVKLFSTDEELEKIIKDYKPDIMVKGSDYEGKPIIGRQYCKAVCFVQHTGHSTSKIIKRISTG